MTPPPHFSSLSRRAALAPLLLCAAFAGCAKLPPPVSPLAGRWQGPMAAGNAAVPSEWEMRPGGTFSLTLALPQGEMAAQGTWSAQKGVLTETTTARVVIIGGEQKRVPLASPMQTTFAYRLQGDALTLTRAGTRQKISLTRDRGAKKGSTR